MHCIALRCVALRCVASHCVALRCVALHCVALHCIALHCIHTYMHTYLVRVCEIGIVWYRLLLQGLTIRSERTSFCKSFVLTVCSNSGPSHGYHCHQVQIPLGGTRWHAPCHAPAVSRENVQDDCGFDTVPSTSEYTSLPHYSDVPYCMAILHKM